MRSKSKKLVLHRETVSDLDRVQLSHAAGGATFQCPSFTCYPGVCDFSGRRTCLTCQLTCTTNHC